MMCAGDREMEKSIADNDKMTHRERKAGLSAFN